jgi:hypothetical protein
VGNQWFYKRSNEKEKKGPFSDSQLRKLASDGILLREDHIWKEGMEKWRLAGSVKGLFQPPVQSTPRQESVCATSSKNLEQTTASASTDQGISLTNSAKLAGQLTINQAELTKIQQLSLPEPQAFIGKQAFEAGIGREAFAIVFRDIERLIHSIEDLKKSRNNVPELKTFSDRARSLGGNASTAAKLKVAEFQCRQKFQQLGKVVFESGLTPDSCLTQKKDIEKLLARADELQSQISAAKGKLSIARRGATTVGYQLLSSSPMVIALAILCAPIGLWLVWRHTKWTFWSKSKWTVASFG